MAEHQDFESLLPLRLHQSSPIFLFVDTLKEFFLLFVVAIFASKTEAWQIWAIGFSAFIVLPRMISVRFFKYWILPDELVVKSGVFFRQERHIPYERIQNINQTQGILHRIFGVCKVQLESASGTKPEAVFNVIDLDAIEEIRKASQSIGQGKGLASNSKTDHDEQDVSTGGAADTLLELRLPELVKHGLITQQGLIPVAVAFGFLSQQDQLFGRFIWPWLELHVPLVNTIASTEFSVAPGLVIASLLGLFVFILICFAILSIAVSIFRFYKFTLTQDNHKLLSVMGLITRQSASATINRIQKITIKEGVLHRMFNRVSVSCKTAGNTRDSNNLSKSFHYLAPIMVKEKLQILLAKVQGDIDWSFLETDNANWTPIPYRAWRRMVKIPLLICTVLAIIVAYKFSWLAVVFIPVAIFLIYAAQRSAKAMGYIYTKDFMAYRSGWITKKISLVPIGKTQAVSLHQNPFDRRRNMARLLLDTAGFSLSDHNIDIPYLEFEDADFLQKTISAQMNMLEFEW